MYCECVSAKLGFIRPLPYADCRHIRNSIGLKQFKNLSSLHIGKEHSTASTSNMFNQLNNSAQLDRKLPGCTRRTRIESYRNSHPVSPEVTPSFEDLLGIFAMERPYYLPSSEKLPIPPTNHLNYMAA
jgi:hypothetical protein